MADAATETKKGVAWYWWFVGGAVTAIAVDQFIHGRLEEERSAKVTERLAHEIEELEQEGKIGPEIGGSVGNLTDRERRHLVAWLEKTGRRTRA